MYFDRRVGVKVFPLAVEEVLTEMRGISSVWDLRKSHPPCPRVYVTYTPFVTLNPSHVRRPATSAGLGRTTAIAIALDLSSLVSLCRATRVLSRILCRSHTPPSTHISCLCQQDLVYLLERPIITRSPESLVFVGTIWTGALSNTIFLSFRIMSNVTPRKRKAAVMDPEPPARTPRARGKGQVKRVYWQTDFQLILSAPALNPPLVPFPTPPSSRHRHIKTPLSPSNVDLLPTHPIASSSTSATRRKPNGQPLPPHLQNLLSLHNAFNLALSLHMATHPPVLPSHPPTQTKLDLANLTNFLNIKETVERTGGRRFGLPELGRLAWVWSWDGEHLPGDKTVSQKNKGINEDDNPFLEPSGTIATSSIRVCGMSYLITPTRTLDSSGRRVHTHGLGIELDLKPGETRQLVLSGYEDGMGDGGQGGGMGAVGRWSAGQEAREELFRRRLERWAELHGGYEVCLSTPLANEARAH